jgi:predicted aspartyl protease
LPQVTTISPFSGRAKLCFIRDEKSGQDFLVDTGAISLLPFQSTAAATGPQLQAVNKQAIKTWNFVNTAVKFNGWEYTFAFLRADVPFPIVGLDFLHYFGMQVNPSSPAILIAPTSQSQEGGTAGGGGLNPPNSNVSARKEAHAPQLIAAASARPIHTQVLKMLQGGVPTAAAAVNGGPTTYTRGGTPYPHRW